MLIACHLTSISSFMFNLLGDICFVTSCISRTLRTSTAAKQPFFLENLNEIIKTTYKEHVLPKCLHFFGRNLSMLILDDFRATLESEGSLKFRTARHLAFDDCNPHAACCAYWCVHQAFFYLNFKGNALKAVFSSKL